MLLIIIDSSHQLTYSGVISGKKKDIEELFYAVDRIFRENNVGGKFHWSKLSRKTKEKLKNQLAAELSESERIKLNVFLHRRQQNVQRKDWFIYNLPARISQRLEGWLMGKKGSAEIIVDNDYNVVAGGNGTELFAASLLRQISTRLTGKESTIRRTGEMRMSIKKADGAVLDIGAAVAPKDSKWVGLADIYLGLYISEPELFKNSRNVFFHEL